MVWKISFHSVRASHRFNSRNAGRNCRNPRFRSSVPRGSKHRIPVYCQWRIRKGSNRGRRGYDTLGNPVSLCVCNIVGCLVLRASAESTNPRRSMVSLRIHLCGRRLDRHESRHSTVERCSSHSVDDIQSHQKCIDPGCDDWLPDCIRSFKVFRFNFRTPKPLPPTLTHKENE